jgi:hypothetical protein
MFSTKGSPEGVQSPAPAAKVTAYPMVTPAPAGRTGMVVWNDSP